MKPGTRRRSICTLRHSASIRRRSPSPPIHVLPLPVFPLLLRFPHRKRRSRVASLYSPPPMFIFSRSSTHYVARVAEPKLGVGLGGGAQGSESTVVARANDGVERRKYFWMCYAAAAQRGEVVVPDFYRVLRAATVFPGAQPGE